LGLFYLTVKTQYHPTLEEVKKLSSQGNLVPVYRDIRADMETPVSAYLKIARGDYSFLLESVEGGERLARYSFIGTEPSMVLSTGGGTATDPLELVANVFKNYRRVQVDGLPRFHGGMVGYLSYEVARYYDQLPSRRRMALWSSEACLASGHLRVFDISLMSSRCISRQLDGDIDANYRTH
jgi:anthranilate synthase component 1